MVSTNPARGMRDFLPADVRKREYVIGIIKQVYESFGYEPLETPSVENLDTLMGKYGEEGNQLIFKILKRGEKLGSGLELIREPNLRNKFREATLESKLSGETLESAIERAFSESLVDLGLRYDLTVPLARVVANRRNDIPKFFKRYQIQPVWRADRPAKGRFREFYQCDVDAIGSRSVLIEAEQINAVSTILLRLGFKDFVVRINHRELLRAMLTASGIREEQSGDALVAIDKLDKIGPSGVLAELGDRGIAAERGEQILGLFTSLNGSNTEAALASLSSFIGDHDSGVLALQQLKEITSLCGEGPVRVDPSLARGLSYYTGTIMEINVPDLAGSLGGGGRYDGLIGMFGKEQIPACGFSLGLERILVVMEERGMFPPEIAESRAADVMVTIWNEDSIAESMKLAAELRGEGLRVLLYPEADKLGKQFKYADSINIPFTCVIGESELVEDNVTLKNMSNGKQRTFPRQQITDVILNNKDLDATD